MCSHAGQRSCGSVRCSDFVVASTVVRHAEVLRTAWWIALAVAAITALVPVQAARAAEALSVIGQPSSGATVSLTLQGVPTQLRGPLALVLRNAGSVPLQVRLQYARHSGLAMQTLPGGTGPISLLPHSVSRGDVGPLSANLHAVAAALQAQHLAAARRASLAAATSVGTLALPGMAATERATRQLAADVLTLLRSHATVSSTLVLHATRDLSALACGPGFQCTPLSTQSVRAYLAALRAAAYATDASGLVRPVSAFVTVLAQTIPRS